MKTTDVLSLADGFLLGKDDSFSVEFKNLVQKAGVTHLVAASGANLVFLESIFSPLFQVFPIRLRKVIVLLGCLFYFRLVGPSGSLWRAVVMWLLSWGGQWFGRRTSLVWLLGQVVVITAIFGRDFFASASFWLSWLAMIGLFFSRQKIFRENNFSYFPYSIRVLNYLKQSFFTGWWVLLCVSVWLWSQYGVFQPHGIVVTWGIEPIVPWYMIAALHWRFTQLFCEWWPMRLCIHWEIVSVQLLTVLYWPIERWLVGWEWWLGSPVRSRMTMGSVVGIGLWMMGSILYSRIIKSNLVVK